MLPNRIDEFPLDTEPNYLTSCFETKYEIAKKNIGIFGAAVPVRTHCSTRHYFSASTIKVSQVAEAGRTDVHKAPSHI